MYGGIDGWADMKIDRMIGMWLGGCMNEWVDEVIEVDEWWLAGYIGGVTG